MRGLLYNGLVLSDTQQRRDADCGPKRTKNKRVTIIGHTGNVGYTDSEYIVQDGDRKVSITAKDAYLNYTILKPAYVLSIKKFKSKFGNKREMFITINDYVNDLDTLDEDLMDNVKYYCINVKELLEKIAEKINQKYSQKIKLVLPEAPDLMLTANERKHGLYNSYKDIEQSLASSTIRFTRESYGKLSESNLRIGSDGSIDLVSQDMELESKVNMYGYGSYGITKLRELIFSDTVLDDIFSMLDEVEARTDSVVMLKDFLETKEVVEKLDTIYDIRALNDKIDRSGKYNPHPLEDKLDSINRYRSMIVEQFLQEVANAVSYITDIFYLDTMTGTNMVKEFIDIFTKYKKGGKDENGDKLVLKIVDELTSECLLQKLSKFARISNYDNHIHIGADESLFNKSTLDLMNSKVLVIPMDINRTLVFNKEDLAKSIDDPKYSAKLYNKNYENNLLVAVRRRMISISCNFVSLPDNAVGVFDNNRELLNMLASNCDDISNGNEDINRNKGLRPDELSKLLRFS